MVHLTFWLEYSICGFTIEISWYFMNSLILNYTHYKYEIYRTKNHEMRAKYVRLIFFFFVHGKIMKNVEKIWLEGVLFSRFRWKNYINFWDLEIGEKRKRNVSRVEIYICGQIFIVIKVIYQHLLIVLKEFPRGCFSHAHPNDIKNVPAMCNLFATRGDNENYFSRPAKITFLLSFYMSA